MNENIERLVGVNFAELVTSIFMDWNVHRTDFCVWRGEKKKLLCNLEYGREFSSSFRAFSNIILVLESLLKNFQADFAFIS